MKHADYHYLILPGWQGSADDHWQTHWQHCLAGSQRLQVASWSKPNPQDWRQQLDRLVSQTPSGIVLIAHSLGCINLAHWANAASSQQLQRIAAALLVAPADVERPGCPQALTGFAPIQPQPLPFPALVIGSSNDPAASTSRVLELARHWQADCRILQGAGHINTASGHHQWTEGLALMKDWLQSIRQRSRVA